MFEKILKRLCPCYYNQKNDSTACPLMLNKTTELTQTSRAVTSNSVITSAETGAITTSSSTSVIDSLKKTLIKPQPIYAFPVDLKKSVKKHQKNLLKPPLYWKKTTKSFHLEGPPVFQESRNKSAPYPDRKFKKKKPIQLKHSETVADLYSATSPSTVEVKWLKSQSLENVSFSTISKKLHNRKKHRKKQRDERKNLNGMLSQVVHDNSQGVILFTAAYFTTKKTCMINIDRLENLPKKGREGNSYYSVVKVAVLPSEKYLKCTKILANCSDPDIKEEISFSVKELSGKVLRLSVFDASLQKQHEAVGHALLTLEDIIFNQPKKYRIKLYKRSQPHICPGNLDLSLKYTEDEDKFTIIVDKATNLSLQKDKNVKLNTYVKVTLHSYGEKVKTKKSIIVFDSRNPNYSSTFTFQVRRDQIDYLSAAITVRLKGFISDLTIGRLNFGPFFYVDFENKKLTPWGRVFLKREFVSHWFRMYL